MVLRGAALPLLVVLLAVHLASIALFAKGFFLTRFEVQDRSACGAPPVAGAPAADGGCWWRGADHRRAVILVVDALRYDFLAPAPANSSFAHGRVPVVGELLDGAQERSLLMRFVADPPTVTMQRLKGLTTGGLPTFIDISSNFDSTEISEDNLVQQLHDAGRRMVFLGDDTWMSLFPTQFNVSHAFPSFNVRDLHTVDNGILEHLVPQIQRDDGWDLVVAHFLGVDHVGHTFGMEHPSMADKLAELDATIRAVVDAMPDDALLLVMGDHGMTDDGNHGGSSTSEVEAALFVHSPHADLPGRGLDAQLGIEDDRIAQIDLVPTLAALLGVPAPFGNLGAIIPSLAASVHVGGDAPVSDPVRRAVAATRVNAAQVHRYLDAYARLHELPGDTMHELHVGIQRAHALFDDPDSNPLETLAAYREYLAAAILMCRSLWSTFDTTAMTAAIVIMGTGCAMLAYHHLLPQARVSAAVILGGAFVGGVVTIVGSILHDALNVDVDAPEHDEAAAQALPEGDREGEVTDLFWISGGAAFGAALAHIVGMVRAQAAPSLKAWRAASLPRLAALVCLVLHGAALFTNSYIVAEYDVYRFLLTTMLVVLARRAVQLRLPAPYAVSMGVALVLTRLTAAVVEQADRGGGEAPVGDTLGWEPATSAAGFVAQSLVPLALVVFYLLPGWIGKVDRFSGSWIGHLTLIKAAGAAAFFWSLQHAEMTENVDQFVRVTPPRAVYLSVVIVFVLAVGVVARRRESVPLIAGALFVLLALLLGRQSPWIVFAQLAIMLAVAGVQDALVRRGAQTTHLPSGSGRLARSSAAGDERDTLTFAFAITWTLIAGVFFFATGHDNAFNTLQYRCAFFGMDEFEFVRAGVLLWLNTYASHILAVLLVPMLHPGIDLDAVLRITVLFHALNLMLTAIFVHMERRHLMVWAIFAPKFLFDATLVVTIDILVIAATVLMRGLWVVV